MHISNFKQANAKIIVDLINESNSTSLTVGQLTFAAPVAGVAEATTLVVSSATGSGYRGDVEVSYNRVPMSFMNTNEPGLVIETPAETVYGLIDFLNTTFGIQLTEADLVDGALPAGEADVNKDLVITAAADSLVWFGPVTLQVTMPLVTLNTVLTVTTLDGLYAPAAV